MISVSPTFKGFTPIGVIICGSALALAVQGSVRVGICEVRAKAPDQCAVAWDNLRSDLTTAGLGIGGLLAQSPVSAFLAGFKGRQQPQRPRRGPDGRFTRES